MSLLAFALLATSSLFVIVDPVSAVPAFLTMTARQPPGHRAATARLACLLTCLILSVFGLFGSWVFRIFGITLPAFQLAASVILLLVALDMLRAQRSRVRETREETDAGAAKEDVAVTPLAVPMLAGPGAISTAIVLHTQARDTLQQLVLMLAIAVVCGATYLILSLSAHGTRWLGPIALGVVTRVMGLVLAAVAVQFMLDAVAALRVTLLR